MDKPRNRCGYCGQQILRPNARHDGYCNEDHLKRHSQTAKRLDDDRVRVADPVDTATVR